MSPDSTDDPGLLESAAASAAAIAAAAAPSDVFRLLLEGTRLATPRAAVFLLRDGAWKGWGGRGYDEEVSQRLRRSRIPMSEGWLAPLASSADPVPVRRPGGETVPSFGQSAPDEALAIPLGVGERTIALLLAERAAGEEPWFPPVLTLLVVVARSRLELDLARRRLRNLTPAAFEAGAEPEPAPTGVSPSAEPPDARPPEPLPTSLSPWPQEDSTRPEGARWAEARRFARLVATDIRLYNEEAIVLGRRNRDLERRLGDHLERGREAFERRFHDLGSDGEEILREAYVQILAGGDSTLLPSTRVERA